MLRVLVVDDEILLTLVLRAQLEARGCQVVDTVGNGQAAVEACCATRPEVVLMDIRMPVMDGLEATRVIMEQCPTCVVMMTAYGAADTASRAEAAGAMGYQTKPVRVERLLGSVPAAQARFAEFDVIRAEAADLEEALATRRLTDAAKEVLAARGGKPEEGFATLQHLAEQEGRSLRITAERLLAECRQG